VAGDFLCAEGEGEQDAFAVERAEVVAAVFCAECFAGDDEEFPAGVPGEDRGWRMVDGGSFELGGEDVEERWSVRGVELAGGDYELRLPLSSFKWPIRF